MSSTVEVIEPVPAAAPTLIGVRQTPRGTYEATVYNKSLPGGRISRTFETPELAAIYRAKLMAELDAGSLQKPVKKEQKPEKVALSRMLQDYLDSDTAKISKSDRPLVEFMRDTIDANVDEITIEWLEAWIRILKQKNVLAPGTIRKRVESLGRALAWWHRTPGSTYKNPVGMLPRGYSAYGEHDVRTTGVRKVDTERDRRLHDGEQERIEAALTGTKSKDRERPLTNPDRAQLLMLFRLIICTGLRLREAYRLIRADVDLASRVIRVQKSKTGKPRFVPMTRQLTDWMIAYMKTVPEGRQTIFPWWHGSNDETYLRSVTARLSSRFRTLFDYVGSGDLIEHDLRHEAACRWMLMRDQNGQWLYRPEEVQRILGHKSPQQFSRYLSLRGTDLVRD